MQAAFSCWTRQRNKFFPRACRGSTALPIPWFQPSDTFDLQNCRGINACHLKSLFAVIYYSSSRRIIDHCLQSLAPPVPLRRGHLVLLLLTWLQKMTPVLVVGWTFWVSLRVLRVGCSLCDPLGPLDLVQVLRSASYWGNTDLQSPGLNTTREQMLAVPGWKVLERELLCS